MNRRFKMEKDPWDAGYEIFTKGDIGFEPGVTILVGCNGSGKSTMLQLIEDALRSSSVPVMSYDNMDDGIRNKNNPELMGNLMTSSEGEQIYLNIGYFASKIKSFIESNSESNELWFIFDGIDSGLSIDNINDVKELFKLIIKDHRDKKIYILCSANTYSMCIEEKCFDVTECEYLYFWKYEEYRKFILSSHDKKNLRK